MGLADLDVVSGFLNGEIFLRQFDGEDTVIEGCGNPGLFDIFHSELALEGGGHSFTTDVIVFLAVILGGFLGGNGQFVKKDAIIKAGKWDGFCHYDFDCQNV